MYRWYQGGARDIVFGSNADNTFVSSIAEVPSKPGAADKQIRARLKLVGSVQTVSTEICRHEGERVFAVRANNGLRGYGWFDQYEGRGAFIVNHFVYKTWKKMRSSDRALVVAARETYRKAKEDDR
jgi:hypothetical protein